MQVAAAPAVMRTILGSCVGIALYDKSALLGGLAHIMLPLRKDSDPHVAKYANSAIPALVTLMEEKHGANRRSLSAKITGGATMFTHRKKVQAILDIGNNNIKAVRFCLEKLRIPIVGEDVGANYGRRVEFDLATGQVSVKVQGQTLVVL